MSNNKQSSVEWLESEITKRGPSENNPPQWLKDLYSQAKAMHKKEIEAAYWAGVDEDRMIYPSEDCNGYYNETFGGNK